MKNAYRRVISSHLREDTRIEKEPLAQKRIYRDDAYEILLLVYPPYEREPKSDLVVGVVRYLEERLELFVKLEVYRASKHPEKHIEALVKRYHTSGTDPLQLIRDAKIWCNIPLTHRDLNNLFEAGLSAA